MTRACCLALIVVTASCGGRSALTVRDGGPAERPIARDWRQPPRDLRPPWVDAPWFKSDLSPWPPHGRCAMTCNSPADCSLAFKACLGGKCRQCSADADCGLALFKAGCDTATGDCLMCKKDSDCTVPGLTAGCDIATGQCRACKADSDCVTGIFKKGTGMCDPTDATCVRCKKDADCAYPGTMVARCNLARMRCGCMADADCTPAIGNTGLCDLKSGYCFGCTTKSQCQKAFASLSTTSWSCLP